VARSALVSDLMLVFALIIKRIVEQSLDAMMN